MMTGQMKLWEDPAIKLLEQQARHVVHNVQLARINAELAEIARCAFVIRIARDSRAQHGGAK